MTTILKNIFSLFFVLSLGAFAQAAGVDKADLKTEEVKKFSKNLEDFGITGVQLNGLDALVNVRPELKSSFNGLLKQMEAKPDFFRTNKDVLKPLVMSINGATGKAAEVLDKNGDGAGGIKVPATVAKERTAEVKQDAEDVIDMCAALPGALASLGKNADFARFQRVADILARTTRKNIFGTRAVPGVLDGTEAAPKSAKDIKELTEKAMNDNRTDGKKFTFKDLIELCLNALRGA